MQIPPLNVASSHQLVETMMNMPLQDSRDAPNPAVLQQSAQFLPKTEPVVQSPASPIKVSETRVMASNEDIR